jgi:hypothetical protein
MDPDQLLGDYFDDELPPEKLAELAEWMKHDAARVRLFAQRAAMESHLKDLLAERAMGGPSKLWPPEEPDEDLIQGFPAIALEEDPPIEHAVPLVPQPRGGSPVSGPSRLYKLRWMAAAAAVILCLLIAGIWNWLPGGPVAIITTAVNVQWEDGSSAEPGAPLGTLPRVLSAGVTELKLRNGVRIVVEAPARFTLVSPGRVRLDTGRLSAMVPPTAHGFTVEVAGGEFVDLGTEFAVDVRAGYPTYAEVFRGLIRANLVDSSHHLVASQSVWASHAVELRDGGSIMALATPRTENFAMPGEVSETYTPRPPYAADVQETTAPATQPVSADIKYIGSAKDTADAAEATHWRTATVKKSKDVTGSQIYGSSLGCVNWTHGSAGEQAKGSSTLGWAYVDSGSQFSKDVYVPVDDANDATKTVNAGISLEHFQFELTGAAADYEGKTVRVGVMQDCLGKDEQAQDTFKGLKIVKTGTPGGGQSDVQAVRGGAAGAGTPELYFFDLTNVKPGDTFDVQALKDIGGTSGNEPYVGPVCWDITSTAAPTK